MAQKIIICEGAIGEDLLLSQPLAGLVADGYEVTQVSGFSARDNKLLCAVFMSEPAEDGGEGGDDTEPQGGDDTEPQGGSDTEPQGGSDAEGGSDNTGGE